MQYEWITGIVLLIGVIFLVISAMVLFRGRWFLAWLRGSFGLLLLLVSLFFAGIALNFYSYKQLLAEVPIATVSFEKIGNQHFEAMVSEVNGREASYELKGDLWQIDARVLKWSGFWNSLGIANGYKLDRIQGRYLSLEQERGSERTVYAFDEEQNIGVDVWAFLNKHAGLVPGIDATYGSATYVPMTDGAIFSVSLAGAGLVAKPLNDRADLALKAWDEL